MSDIASENRMAEILQYLRKAQTSSVSALASRLHVSERTIRNDIRQLNEDFKSCAVIDGEKGRYSLRIYDLDEYRRIYARIAKSEVLFNSGRSRREYIFGSLMHTDEPLLSDDLAYEMNIGRTTFIGDLKKLRQEIKSYDLTILGMTSKGLVLQGREEDIRHYVLKEMYSSFYEDYPLDPEALEIVRETMKQQEFEKDLRESMERYVTVMLDRYVTGHGLGQLSARYYNMVSRKEFQAVSDMVDQLGEFYQTRFPVEEKIFVFLPVAGMRTPADSETMHAIMLEEDIRPLASEIFHKIHQRMNVQLEGNAFEEEFLYHLMFMLNRIRYHVDLSNPMLEELHEKYPLAFKMADIAAEVIADRLNLSVNEDELGYLAAYFGLFLTENNAEQKPFRVAVVCGTGRVTARLVTAQLRKILDSSAEIVTFSDEKVRAEELAQYDIVLTTVELPFRCERPTIRIHEIFDEQELLQKIEKAKYWDQVNVPVVDNNWFVMTGLLDKSRFFVFDSSVAYEDAVEEMVNTLTDQKQVDKDFLARLRQREKKGSLIFGQKAALPHAVQYQTDKLVLAVGVFPNGCEVGNDDLQCIFLLALPEKEEAEENLLIRVYDEVIEIVQDENLLRKISESKSFSSLLRVLYRRAGS